MKEALSCPVDSVLINENKARIIALFVLALAVLFLITGNIFLIAFLLVDFLLRTFNLGSYSPLGAIADLVVRLFKVKYKPTDRAPKRFAAGTGLVFTILILITGLLNLQVLSFALAVTLAFFAFLESFFAFCAGCHVYSLLQKFK